MTLTAERRRSSSHGLKVGGFSQSSFINTLASTLPSFFSHTPKLLKPSIMSYPTPSPFYDILPNDHFHVSYTNQVENEADRAFGQSCHFPPTGGEQPSLYPTYNGLAPFQVPASLPSNFSSSVASSTSGESPQPWVQSSSTLADALTFQPIPEPETQESKVIPAAKRRGKGKRRPGSDGIEIERPAGSGYAAMFVRPALNTFSEYSP